MLTTIVCLVALVGSHTTQPLTFTFTPTQVTELRQDFGQDLQSAVCTHLDHAVAMAGEE